MIINLLLISLREEQCLVEKASKEEIFLLKAVVDNWTRIKTRLEGLNLSRFVLKQEEIGSGLRTISQPLRLRPIQRRNNHHLLL
jgi:hypothetical protein